MSDDHSANEADSLWPGAFLNEFYYYCCHDSVVTLRLLMQHLWLLSLLLNCLVNLWIDLGLLAYLHWKTVTVNVVAV